MNDRIERTDIRLRVPTDLKEWMQDEARRQGGTLNAEIVRALIEHRERKNLRKPKTSAASA